MAEAREVSPQEPRTELSRDLGLFDITMVGVAGMIGAGIFVLTGMAAGEAGPALIMAFALNGVLTLLTGMTYAELGSAIPAAGGGYQWVKEGLPGGNGFLSGWMSWFASAVAGSLYAVGFAHYFVLALKDAGVILEGKMLLGMPLENVLLKILAVAIISSFIYINYKGASETGLAGSIVTIGKLMIIWLFVLSGLWVILQDPSHVLQFTTTPVNPGGFAPHGFSGVLTAMGLTFIAFEGYEIIAQAGEEVKKPRTNIPKAVFWAMAIVIPTYMAVAFVSLAAPDVAATTTWEWLSGEHAEVALAEAARSFMPLGSTLLMVGALLSTMSALNAVTYSATRMAFAMGRDRNLPDMFAAVHPRTRVPHVALLFSGAFIAFIAVAIPIDAIAAAASLMFLMLFLQVNVACITIRRRYGDKLRYGYLVPFFPYVQIAAIISQIALIIYMLFFSPLAGGVALCWIVSGLFIYHFYASRREREKEITPVVAVETPQIDRRRFSVLVPVANPETAGTLLTVASRLLRLEPGNLMLVHVITVPDQLPVSVGRDFIDDTRPLLDAVSARAEDLGMVPNSIVRVGHRAADAIVDTVQDSNANFVVMGWAGHSRDPRTIIGSTIDKIVKDANTNVVVVRGDVKIPARRILVPVQHPQHGNLMAQFAAVMAEEEGSYVRLLHVVDRHASSLERAQRAADLREAVTHYTQQNATAGQDSQAERRFHIRIEAGDVVDTIVSHSADFDLVIVGASRESWLRRNVWGAKTARVARRIKAPLMLVNMRSGRMKFSVSHFFQFFWDIEETEA